MHDPSVRLYIHSFTAIHIQLCLFTLCPCLCIFFFLSLHFMSLHYCFVFVHFGFTNFCFISISSIVLIMDGAKNNMARQTTAAIVHCVSHISNC